MEVDLHILLKKERINLQYLLDFKIFIVTN